ncbi:DUF7309 domain-containing protein [Paenibacillus planticolens]|uniref:Uncharacterized protein n=1 Tax=Paenibacillus planticolens TaxID=2654976 RepID=A0ABX1ZMX3_9BACL|nr:hypothetical protein [Paenibacillus planticolens]NOV01439.1 hypothetical protein [Paenibacillus planticolens]
MNLQSMEQWTNLYEAAAAFKRAACWEHLSNGHIFGVQNPLNGEIGYCCVMGGGGDLYGLAVYLGTEGLETLMSMFEGDSNQDPMFTQHCLMLSFDNRTELLPAEYKQIKELGLKFRGANAWPTFRLYEPGFLPWPIENQEHVLFLTLALQQAVEVAEAYKHNPDALLEGANNTFLTRVSTGEQLNLTWSDEWIEPMPIEVVMANTADPIDELRVAKVKKSLKKIVAIWEIDCFYMPMPIDEGERPYYPMMILIVDHESGQILHFGLAEKSEVPKKMAERLFEILDKMQVIPKGIWVCNENVANYLRQLLHAFEIEAHMILELPALEEAKEGIMDHFLNG